MKAMLLRLSARVAQRYMVLFGVYTFMASVVLPRASTEAIPPLDLRFWYRPADIQAALASADESERRLFIIAPLHARSGAFFDWLENLTLSTLALAYPAVPGGLAWLAACFTAAKWTAIALTFMVLILHSLVWLHRW